MGALQAAVVFDERDTAFVADMAGGVQAFAADGKCMWKVTVGKVSATPLVAPGSQRLLVGNLGGDVCALDTSDGKSVWHRSIPTKSDPRILSDLLYVPQANAVVLSSWGGRFCALDATSGEEKFAWDAGPYPYAGAAAAPEGRVYCVRAVEGKGVELVQVTIGGEATVLHRQPEEKRGARRTVVAAAPVLDPQRRCVYAIMNGDRQGRLIAWSLASQSLAWEYIFEHCVQATPAVAPDGTIVVADLGGFVHALRADGSVRFRYPGGCDYWLAAPVVDGAGTVFIGDPLGRLHVIDPQGAGQRLFEASRSIQARGSFDSTGRFYLPCTDGRVYVN
jgi:outer membrane protein assembly factor BamB